MRWLPLSGVAFAGCFAVAVGVYGGGAGSHAGEIISYYASEANRLRQIAGFAVLLVGCLLLALYAVVLAREVARDEPLATVAVVSGAGCAVLLAAANALWAATAFTAELEPPHTVSARAHLLVEDAGFAFFVSAMAVAIPLVVATSLAAARSSRLPRWFAVLGVLAAAGLAGAYWYFPVVLFLVWTASGSVLLTWRRTGRAA